MEDYLTMFEQKHKAQLFAKSTLSMTIKIIKIFNRSETIELYRNGLPAIRSNLSIPLCYIKRISSPIGANLETLFKSITISNNKSSKKYQF